MPITNPYASFHEAIKQMKCAITLSTQLLGVDELLSGEAVTVEERPAGAEELPSRETEAAEEKSAEGAVEGPPVSTTTTLSDSAGEQPVQGQAPEEPSRRRGSLVGIAVLVALVALGVLGVFLSDWVPELKPEVGPFPMEPVRSARPRGPEKTPGVAVGIRRGPPATLVPARPKEAPRSPRAGVRITLKLSPASARVLLDGQPRKDNPLVLGPSAGVHLLRVEAQGYLPLERKVRAAADRTLELKLQRRARAPRKATPRRRGRRPPAPVKAAGKKPARKMPFAGGLEDEGRHKAPAPKKKATPFSGDL